MVKPLFFVSLRQSKDQTKKVASLKHKEQVEKNRNARLMEEARKREDNLSENSQQVKVRCMCGSLNCVHALKKQKTKKTTPSISKGRSSSED